MCDFKPGDEVVCVNASPSSSPNHAWSNGHWVPPVEGTVYTVAGLGITPSGVPVLYLADLANSHLFTGVDCGYWIGRFRKVERRTDKQSLTEWLSQPSGDTDHLDKPLPAKKRERA